MPLPKRDMTDWERVKREYDSNAPIPYDPEDGPYDPNDDAAVDAFFDKATIWSGWPNPVMIQKDGVPVIPTERAVSKVTKRRAKAS
jgi:hypothetical protein